MKAALILILALLAVAPATAQQRRYYDSRGNTLGTSSTDSQGTTTYYDARGNVIRRKSTPK